MDVSCLKDLEMKTFFLFKWLIVSYKQVGEQNIKMQLEKGYR